MQVKIKSLELSHFKGVVKKKIDFTGNSTTILGDNGTGKSTIADAFSWLLFGKNVENESDTKFGIKTRNANGTVIPKLEHSVEALLLVDGEEIEIKRVLKEKWVKKRGSIETVFEGNLTEYYWNNVPKSKREYEAKISSLIAEDVFKLITNPLAFNAIHWEKQRQILIAVVGGEEDDFQVARTRAEFQELLDVLRNKTIDEYKKELAAKRKKLNDAIRDIPARIHEVTIGKPEELDWDALKKEADSIQLEISKNDELMSSASKAQDEVVEKRQKLVNEGQELKIENDQIRSDIKKKVYSIEDPKEKLNQQKTVLERQLDSRKTTLERQERELKYEKDALESVGLRLKQKRTEWDELNAKEIEFDKESQNCPSCNRPLDVEDLEREQEKLRTAFNKKKSIELNVLNNEGQLLKKKEDELKGAIINLESGLHAYRTSVKDVEDELIKIHVELENQPTSTLSFNHNANLEITSRLEKNEKFVANLKKRAELKKQYESIEIKTNTEFLKNSNRLRSELETINNQLKTKKQIAEADKRIVKLNEEENDFAQQIANIEKSQFLVTQFINSKVESLEVKINNLFDGVVQFKMFKEQINGIEPWCTCTVNGVNFSDVNTAGKINGGMAIINVLCEHYNVYAPIWIDNRESVVNLIETKSQIINLQVKEGQKKLEVI